MLKYCLLIAVLLAGPVQAAEFSESYAKLFDIQLDQAKKGDAGAQYSVGEMYEQGLGTPKDLIKAYEWYGRAAAKGDIRAKYKLRDQKPEYRRKVKQKVKQTQTAKPAAPAPQTDAELKEAKKRAAAKAALRKQRRRARQDEIGW